MIVVINKKKKKNSLFCLTETNFDKKSLNIPKG